MCRALYECSNSIRECSNSMSSTIREWPNFLSHKSSTNPRECCYECPSSTIHEWSSFYVRASRNSRIQDHFLCKIDFLTIDLDPEEDINSPITRFVPKVCFILALHSALRQYCVPNSASEARWTLRFTTDTPIYSRKLLI